MSVCVWFTSSNTEVKFPVNIGITGHVATTGEVYDN